MIEELITKQSEGSPRYEKRYQQTLQYTPDLSELERTFINRLWHYLQALPLDFILEIRPEIDDRLRVSFVAYGHWQESVIVLHSLPDDIDGNKYARLIVREHVAVLFMELIKRTEPLL